MGGFTFKEETPLSIKNIIDDLKTNVAVGHDQLPAKLYKNMSEALCTSICRLINLSFKLSIFPKTLKHAIVKPIYKNKGTPEEPEFYRPLSILTVLSKIFERAAKNQITKHLEETGKLYQSQHAYRRYHSTTTSLAEVTDHLHWEIERKNLPAVISTDLSKAFDTVSHPLLLSKLEQMGFGRQCTLWVRSYLSERTQVTRFQDVTSESCKIQSGVPQGSILGPILFIAFTSDLAEAVPECKIVAYADDAVVLVSANKMNNLKKKIETCLTKVQGWYTNNGLLINPSKTEFMVMGNGNHLDITVNEADKPITIPSKDHMKVLGVYIDQKLSWEHHIASIKKKTCYAIRNIARTSKVLPIKYRILLNEALVTPHYNYCDVIYDGCSEKAKADIQRNHNYAARALLGRKKYSSGTQALKELKWLPLEHRRRLHTGVFIHKAVNGKNSQHAVKMVEELVPQHSYKTRAVQKNQLNSLAHSTKQLERAISFRAAKVWNSIPQEMKSHENANTMKNKWQGQLIDAYVTDY